MNAALELLNGGDEWGNEPASHIRPPRKPATTWPEILRGRESEQQRPVRIFRRYTNVGVLRSSSETDEIKELRERVDQLTTDLRKVSAALLRVSARPPRPAIVGDPRLAWCSANRERLRDLGDAFAAIDESGLIASAGSVEELRGKLVGRDRRSILIVETGEFRT